MQDVTYATNLLASKLHILANVPITVNQPPLKRSCMRKVLTTERYVLNQSHLNDQFHLICSCPNILSGHRSKVLQLVVSQPVAVIPTHQLPTAASSLPPQSFATASTSFDLLVEYIEPVTLKVFLSLT